MSKKLKGEPRLCCTNCGAFNVPLLGCGRCRIVQYCSRNCQKDHWGSGNHRKHCVAIEERTPVAAKDYVDVPVGAEQVECCICCCIIETDMCKLPCGHFFHAPCIEGVREFGVSNTCPLCRAVLPENPDSAHDGCYWRYNALLVKRKKGDSIDPAEVQALLSEWTIVADQGQSSAQFMVGVLFMKGDLIPKDWGVSETWFRKAGKVANSWVNLGVILKHRGELGAAVDANEKAIVLDPKNAPAYYNLGLCRLQGEEMDEKAMACFRKAVEIDPKHKDAFYNIGHLLLDRSCYMGATAMFERVLTLDPKNAPAYYNLGLCCLQGEDMDDKAMECFRKAVGIDPKHKDASYNIGQLLIKRSLDAAAMFERLLELDPDREKALTSLAQCF